MSNRDITILVGFAFLTGVGACYFVTSLWFEHHHRKIEETCRYLMEKYFLGIKTKNSVLMWEAMSDMYKICPYKQRECSVRQQCYQCTCPVGFANPLNYRYGKEISPNAISKESIQQILQARRDYKQDLRDGRSHVPPDPKGGINLDYGRCTPRGYYPQDTDG